MEEELTNPTAKDLSKKSDIKLIDFIASTPFGAKQEVAKAILENRTKNKMVFLTYLLVGIAILQAVITTLQIKILLK